MIFGNGTVQCRQDLPWKYSLRSRLRTQWILPTPPILRITQRPVEPIFFQFSYPHASSIVTQHKDNAFVLFVLKRHANFVDTARTKIVVLKHINNLCIGCRYTGYQSNIPELYSEIRPRRLDLVQISLWRLLVHPGKHILRSRHSK